MFQHTLDWSSVYLAVKLMGIENEWHAPAFLDYTKQFYATDWRPIIPVVDQAAQNNGLGPMGTWWMNPATGLATPWDSYVAAMWPVLSPLF